MILEFSKEEEAALQRLHDRLKANDPNWDLNQELGRLLMIHRDDFTPAQVKRYDELLELLRPKEILP